MKIQRINMQRAAWPAPRSHGIVLPIVMIMLLVLTIASLAIVGQISSQTRMAANAGVNQVSLQVAEALLRNVSNQLNGGGIPSAPGNYQVGTGANSTGLYQYNPLNYSATTAPPWNVPADWAAVVNQHTVNPAMCPSPPAPSQITFCGYIIEKLPSVQIPGGSILNVYRITARVTGPGGQGTVTLQTLFQLPQ
jgi:Tfp pilus assembly protein PilX